MFERYTSFFYIFHAILQYYSNICSLLNNTVGMLNTKLLFFAHPLLFSNTAAIFVQDYAKLEECLKFIPYFFNIFLTAAIFVQYFARREECLKCIPHFLNIFHRILQYYSNICPRLNNTVGMLNTKLHFLEIAYSV